MTGGIIGAFTGAALGTATGIPGMGLVGGLIGGYVGGQIGGLFDPEGAGELNYGEENMLNNIEEKQDNPCGQN